MSSESDEDDDRIAVAQWWRSSVRYQHSEVEDTVANGIK